MFALATAVSFALLLLLLIRFVLPETVGVVRDMIVDIRIQEAFLRAAELSQESDLFPLLLQKKLRCENVEGNVNEYLTRVLRIREVFRMCDLRQPTDKKFLKTIKRARRFCIRELAFMLSHIGMQVSDDSQGKDTAIPAAQILGFLLATRKSGQADSSSDANKTISSAGGGGSSPGDVESELSAERFEVEQAAELMIAALYVLAAIPGNREAP